MRLNKITLIIIISIILITIFHFLRWPFFMGKIFLPFQKAFSALNEKISLSLEPIFTRRNLLEENKKLSQETTKLILDNIKVKILEEENEQLRRELNFTKRTYHQSILANVIGRKDEAGISWFILDRGKRDGVKEGVILTSNGIVVGKIIRVMENVSYALSVFNEKVRVAISIISPPDQNSKDESIEGIIKGKNGLTVEIDLVPVDKDIRPGDWVLTSGLEYDVPQGLFIGVLKETETQPANIFHKAVIEVSESLNNLEMVNIVIPQS